MHLHATIDRIVPTRLNYTSVSYLQTDGKRPKIAALALETPYDQRARFSRTAPGSVHTAARRGANGSVPITLRPFLLQLLIIVLICGRTHLFIDRFFFFCPVVSRELNTLRFEHAHHPYY